MYGKVFTSMYDGTLATKGPWQALVTFQQMIVLCDRHGVLDMTAEAISRRTTVPLEIIQTGIAALEEIDSQSRSPDLNGRRIVRLSDGRDWGWQIVNYAHYRNMRSEDERRDYMRKYMKQYRAVNKTVNNVSKVSLGSKQEAGSIRKSTALSGKPDPSAFKSKKQEQTRQHRADAVSVIAFLNARAGRSFKPVAANVDPLVARFREGFTLQNCKSVIAKKVREWKGDDRMEEYLRPKTLFNRTNFANYEGELVEPKDDGNGMP